MMRLLEWLNSPIIYIENGDFANTLREIAPAHVNTIALSKYRKYKRYFFES